MTLLASLELLVDLFECGFTPLRNIAETVKYSKKHSCEEGIIIFCYRMTYK